MSADYTLPYPSPKNHHGMVIDSQDRYLYIFGGDGICLVFIHNRLYKSLMEV